MNTTQVIETVKLSVIIPVYNVATYIEFCVNSILKSIECSLEIILIDDGSTDDSPEICDSIANRDNRVRVFHQFNAGQSVARNKGLSEATGKYICYVDSDDLVSGEMINIMINSLDNCNADFAICNYKKISYDCLDVPTDKELLSEYMWVDNKEFFNHLSVYLLQVWNKVYRRERISNLRFKEGMIYEDVYYTFELAKMMNKAIYFNSVMYYYRLSRPGNTASSFNVVTRIPGYKGVEELAKFVKENYSNMIYQNVAIIVADFFQMQYMECYEMLGEKDILKMIIHKYKEYVEDTPIKIFPLYRFFFRLSPSIFSFYKKIKKSVISR